MSDVMVIELARRTMLLALMLAGPLLSVALGVGVLVSVFQAVTQIQEQTLTFVPKFAAIAIVGLLLMPWFLQQLVRYITELVRSLPLLLGV